MTPISIASSIAIVLGFAGTLPHIRTMVKNRSSNGQSPAGWMIGITVNGLTGYVNLAGAGSALLGIGNVLAGTFSVLALYCVVRFSGGAPAGAATADPRPVAAIHELPTGEFHAIKLLVDEEHARRETFRAEPAATPVEAYEQPHLRELEAVAA